MKPENRWNWTTAALLVTIFVVACGDVPPNPQPPTACGTLEDVELNIRDRVTVEPCFADPEMATLTLTTASSDSSVAFPFLDAQDRVIVTGRSIGEATITITAMDPDSLDVTVAFKANVLDYPLYLDDDFSEDSGEWSYDEGVLFHDGVMSVWATEATDSLGGSNRVRHELEDETTNWRVSTSAVFAHDSVIAAVLLRTAATSATRFQGYGLLLGYITVTDGTNDFPANWVALVYDAEGPDGESWYLYAYEWFGEHADVGTGESVDIEVVGVSDGEVVFKLNGDIVTTFGTDFATSDGVENIELGISASHGYGDEERCPDGVCLDVRYDWIQVRGLQGEESVRPRNQSDLQLTPLWVVVRRN